MHFTDGDGLQEFVPTCNVQIIIVCDKIMANELTDLLYFAYGSNMLDERIRVLDRAPSAKLVATAYVTGRKLSFDKEGRDGSGKCNIEETGDQNDRVYGVIYKISAADKLKLDAAENLGQDYEAAVIRALVPNNKILTAITYVAIRKTSHLPPYHWYKRIVIAGAIQHDLPVSYIDQIRAFGSIDDPNTARRAKNESLIPLELIGKI